MQLTLHPKQSQVFQSPARQILFGGAAGPGKSHLLRVAAIAWAYAIPGVQVYLFRRTFPDLYKNHMEGPTSFPTLLAPWIAEGFVHINYSQHQIAFANTAKIHLVHMQHEHDVDRIQGAEIHAALIDELTHFTKAQYSFIRSRVRMAGVTVPEPFAGHFPRILAASNPGGPGHGWVRELFVTPVPPGTIWLAPPEEGGLTTQFIPALLRDNPSLLRDDPEYANRLRGLSSPELVRAMLEGDWDAMVGGMLDDVFDARWHVREPFEIPQGWRMRRAFDWGSSKPFAVGWFAHSDGESPDPQGRVYPRGTRFLVAEYYGWNGKPNEGVRMTNTEIARTIRGLEDEGPYAGRVKPGPADSQIFDVVNGTSIADEMAREGIRWDAAQKGPGSRRQGAQLLRQRLKASQRWPMEEPGLFIFSTCRQWLRTVPIVPRDPKNPDDVDSDSEDHCFAADTMVETVGGPVRIVDLVGRAGLVLTDHGPQRFVNCRLTRKQAEVVCLTLHQGRQIICTPEHLFLTQHGTWKKAQDLTDETCYNISSNMEDIWKLQLLVRRFKCLTVNDFISAVPIFSARGKGYTRQSGSITTDLFQRGLMSITNIMIDLVTSLKILNSSRVASIANCMPMHATWSHWGRDGLSRRKRQQQCGMALQKARLGIKNTMRAIATLHSTALQTLCVLTATGLFKQLLEVISMSFVPIAVSRPSDVPTGWTAKPVFVAYAKNPSRSLVDIRSKTRVAVPVEDNYVVSVQPVGRADVYCLTVPHGARFAIEGGIIVHNCYDMTRYELGMPLATRAQSIEVLW